MNEWGSILSNIKEQFLLLKTQLRNPRSFKNHNNVRIWNVDDYFQYLASRVNIDISIRFVVIIN